MSLGAADEDPDLLQAHGQACHACHSLRLMFTVTRVQYYHVRLLAPHFYDIPPRLVWHLHRARPSYVQQNLPPIQKISPTNNRIMITTTNI